MPIPLESLLQSGPGFDAPVEMLQACHDRIEGQCDTLLRLLPHLAANGADSQAREAAAAVLRYFDTAGENHHQDEEVDLFPALRAHAGARLPEVEALLAVLLADHQRMRDAWMQQVRPALQAITRGEAALSPAGTQAFVDLYRQHIDRENSELLPLAQAVLGPAVQVELGRHMAARRHVPANVTVKA
ncbi:MAG: hemerythrin domain-containing protein [Betaproteobacteria bacterium]|nr:hemerythrin domain-containing protein [Betaproteobacteria bacterium]